MAEDDEVAVAPDAERCQPEERGPVQIEASAPILREEGAQPPLHLALGNSGPVLSREVKRDVSVHRLVGIALRIRVEGGPQHLVTVHQPLPRLVHRRRVQLLEGEHRLVHVHADARVHEGVEEHPLLQWGQPVAGRHIRGGGGEGRDGHGVRPSYVVSRTPAGAVAPFSRVRDSSSSGLASPIEACSSSTASRSGSRVSGLASTARRTTRGVSPRASCWGHRVRETAPPPSARWCLCTHSFARSTSTASTGVRVPGCRLLSDRGR